MRNSLFACAFLFHWGKWLRLTSERGEYSRTRRRRRRRLRYTLLGQWPGATSQKSKNAARCCCCLEIAWLSFIFIPQRERVTGTGNRAIGVCCAKVNKRAPRVSHLLFYYSGRKQRGPCPNTTHRVNKIWKLLKPHTFTHSISYYCLHNWPFFTCPVDTQTVVCHFFSGGFKVPTDVKSILMRETADITFTIIHPCLCAQAAFYYYCGAIFGFRSQNFNGLQASVVSLFRCRGLELEGFEGRKWPGQMACCCCEITRTDDGGDALKGAHLSGKCYNGFEHTVSLSYTHTLPSLMRFVGAGKNSVGQTYSKWNWKLKDNNVKTCNVSVF